MNTEVGVSTREPISIGEAWGPGDQLTAGATAGQEEAYRSNSILIVERRLIQC